MVWNKSNNAIGNCCKKYDAMIDTLIYNYGYAKDSCRVVVKKIFGVSE